jgi:hypothetical protein
MTSLGCFNSVLFHHICHRKLWYRINSYAKEVFENDSKDVISNSKDTVDVALATDDDKATKAHIIIYESVRFQL